jgi:hypothetical protein
MIVIENVTKFKYLGWIISADDYNDSGVNFNNTKTSKKWYRMYRILSWDTTADSHVMAQFYLAIACSSQVSIWLWNMGWFYPNVASYTQATWIISQSMCLLVL